MKQILYLYIQSIILLHGSLYLCEEYFSSSGHLTSLLKFELKLADELKGLIEHEEGRLLKIKEFIRQTEYIETSSASLIDNPVNSYSLIKRMQGEWHTLKKLIYSVYSTTLTRSIPQFPTEDDLLGARLALLRLQGVFNLDASDIVEGIAQNQGSVKLDAEDSFDIGKLAYGREQYELAANWFNTTIRLINDGRFTTSVNRSRVFHYIVWSEYELDNIPMALKHAQDWLKEEPNNTSVEVVRDFFYKKQHLETRDEEDTASIKGKSNKPQLFCTTYVDREYGVEEAREKALCRGETEPVPKKYVNLLRCWYKTDHPLLILKPVKVEILYPKPELRVYRSILSENEMNAVKEIATLRLNRATVNNPKTGKPEKLESRVSKSAWLSPLEFDLVRKMEKRTGAITGLNMETAEPLQIANYGMGGHYERHFDFSRNVPLRPPPWKNRTETYLAAEVDAVVTGRSDILKVIYFLHTTSKGFQSRIKPEEREFPADGERIATLLYYMSDVTLGGATIFMNIGQAIKPSKGDAIFWYNLNHDGSGDYDTCHAACPVLIGEKWVSNRWFRERGQEFRRRCNLRPEDD